MLMDNEPLVSIIIRTKNEERWISNCLRAVFSQDYKNFEVILVDNLSMDRTIAKAEEFPVKLVNIENFRPGKAINEGIRASSGQLLVILSGHCIPVNEQWLRNIIQDLDDPEIAGVYGRQEPLSYSTPLDKRDLIITFGLDKNVQKKDSFFHNANSALRREMWDKIPFDEDVTNIEDRVWGASVIKAGYKIIYEPDASVYHHHGIHHDRNLERAENIVNIMEKLEGNSYLLAETKIKNENIIAVIPVKGLPTRSNDMILLEHTIVCALEAVHINEVIVATDNEETAELARKFGATTPFIRPDNLSEDYVDIGEVMHYTLEHLEDTNGIPDLVVMLEETYPFRPPGLIDQMIVKMVSEGLDSLVAAKEEVRRIWISDIDGNVNDVGDSTFMPKKLKEHKAHIGLLGLGCVLHPHFIRERDMLGHNTGLFGIEDPFGAIEVRDQQTLENFSPLLELWQKNTFGTDGK